MILRELLRFGKMMASFAFYSLGIYLTIHANIGLAPWDAFAMGLAKTLNSSYGAMNVAIGLGVLLISVGFFREKFGIATPLNAVLIGMGVDVIESWNLLPYIDNFALGVAVLLIGELFICVGTVLYVPIGMGCGPRDSLMMALARRYPKIKIGLVRGGIEVTVLFIGWMLGAKVGLGTIIAAFGVSSLLQLTCIVMRRDLKGVVHESCFDTLRRCKQEFLEERRLAAK